MIPSVVFLAAVLAQQPPAPADDDVRALVSRLELGRYKETLRGLTRFGDRRQGTKRNRDAIDWIEAQLKAAGCTTTERMDYVFDPAPSTGGAPRPQVELNPEGGTPTGGRIGRNGSGPGGSSIFGYRARTRVNTDETAQPDEALRELNREPATNGPRQQVYCTKIGKTRPDEMYLIGAHMDGHGWGEAANDDGSGTALVMELARVFNAPDVETERSIRFVLWNNEETGLNGARA
jgi:acetylornithine deacetylase/succinyl-diaminopimelate desuccinylase-like protein